MKCFHIMLLAFSLTGLLALDVPSHQESENFSFVPAGGEQGKRREQVMQELSKHPYPNTGAWCFVGKALASYWVGEAVEGDRAISNLKQEMQRLQSVGDEDGFHWQAFQIARILFLFGREGAFVPGRMSAEAEKTARQLLWTWLEPRARAVLVEPSKDWWVWGSENHHLQAWFSMWGALKLFTSDPDYAKRTFPDGSTPSQLKRGFDEYFKRWIRNRSTRGLFVECNSGYAKYSLSGFYNFVDFSDDPELRLLAKNFLDLCWAQWALEQVDGNRAGSRHRSYPGAPSIEETGAGSELAWYHFGTGKQSVHPATWCTATSSYVPPALVSEVVKRRRELGAYQITSRQPGLADPALSGSLNYVDDPKYPFYKPKGIYKLDPYCRSILRRTYAAPGFILGATMVRALPQAAWTAISSQNRWDGVVFSGTGAPRIFVQPQKPTQGYFTMPNGPSWIKVY